MSEPSGNGSLPDGSLIQTQSCQMPTAQSGQLAASLVILANQPDPEQERLRYLADRAGRQAEPAGDDVQSGVSFRKNHEVLLLDRPQAQTVDLLQGASPFQMFLRDLELTFATTDTPTGL